MLVEFKYVSLKEAGLTGERAALEALPAMKKAMDGAEAQVLAYARQLRERHGDLRLKSFAVVSLGFERLLWKNFP